jgi:hypothetical protein
LAGQIPRCTAKELASGYTKEEGSGRYKRDNHFSRIFYSFIILHRLY